MGVIARIGSKRFLGTEQKAAAVLDILTWAGLQPEKIGVSEPLREDFSRDRAISMWLDTMRGPIQVAGNFLCKNRSKRFDLSVKWQRGPQAQPNSVTFHIDNRAMKKEPDRYLALFKRLFVELGGLYGFMSEETAYNRQFVPGTWDSLLPGVFWCTTMDPSYVDFFGGRDRLKSGPWFATEELDDGSLVMLLSQNPLDSVLIELPVIENQARAFLGSEAFGNREVYEKDPFRAQIGRVPPLVLPEIRVPI